MASKVRPHPWSPGTRAGESRCLLCGLVRRPLRGPGRTFEYIMRGERVGRRPGPCPRPPGPLRSGVPGAATAGPSPSRPALRWLLQRDLEGTEVQLSSADSPSQIDRDTEGVPFPFRMVFEAPDWGFAKYTSEVLRGVREPVAGHEVDEAPDGTIWVVDRRDPYAAPAGPYRSVRDADEAAGALNEALASGAP